jgi:hypothetical protein
MRRLALILLATLAVLPAAALAAGKPTGDGVFELRNVNGIVTLVGKGVLWGQIDQGSLRVTDTGDGQPLVSGAERVRPGTDPDVTIYWGDNIHFRLNGGKYRIRFKGEGLDLTAIGVGWADMIGNPAVLGDPTITDTGDYAVDGGKWISVPVVEKIVTYGVQPAPVAGP